MKRLFKVFLLLLLVIIFPKNAHAITFSVSKSSDNLKPGASVTITINAEVESNANLSSFTSTLNFDSKLLNYVNGVSGRDGVILNSSNGRVDMSYNGNPINENFTVATLNFTASNQITSDSNSSLSLSLNVTGKNESITSRANSSNIAFATLGTNAFLYSLKIPNATLNPSFRKDIYEYSTDVSDLTEITINAVPASNSAKIQISDNYRNLQKGENLIKIVVTAENGTAKTYNIKVNLTLTPTDEEVLKADATLKSLVVKNQKLTFKPDEKKYFLEVPYKITKLIITPKATNEKAKVEMSSTKLKVGKNTITIKVTSEDTTNTENYEIVVTRKEQEKEIVQTCPDVTSEKEWFIYSLSMFLIFTVGLVLGYLLKKLEVFNKIKNRLKKKKEKKEEKKKEEELSNTIELDTTKVLEGVKKKN